MDLKPIRKPSRTCRMDVTIIQDGKSTVYRVRPVASDIHCRAFQFRKLDPADQQVYHVTQELSGLRSCDCGAATFNDQHCKHVRTALSLGLLLSPREIQALRWHSETLPRTTP